MTKATLIAKTVPVSPEYGNNLKEFIAYCARVSNPANQHNHDTAAKLFEYLRKNKHWSPFEMASLVIEVNTTRDIARQFLRHRSFSFQEFCIAEGSLITMDDDKKIPIEQLYERFLDKTQWEKSNRNVLVYDDSVILKSAEIKEVFNTGVKDVCRLTLEDGRAIEATKDHKFLVIGRGFLPLEKLEIGDLVGVETSPILRVLSTNSRGKSRTGSASNVVSIEYVGEKQTYDIEVDHHNHNYVANGIITHNSQRYAECVEDPVFSEARLQDHKNRQNSLEIDDAGLHDNWVQSQNEIWQLSYKAYQDALAKGIAKEVARKLLPEGLTPSRLYVSGTIRSWLHYIDVRTHESTQKEHRELALAVQEILMKELA
jgi:thymidylate synthase ThyX